MTALEKLVGTFLIGNTEPILKRFSVSEELFIKEKNEALQKVFKRKQDTESQITEQKKFLYKLEKMAYKLSNSVPHSINPYNIFKSIPNMMIAYDHKFKVLDYNDSFVEKFCTNLKECNSGVFNILNDLKKENLIQKKIKIYNKQIEYDYEYTCEYNDEKFKVTTTPVYDDMENFDFFVKIFTKIN